MESTIPRFRLVKCPKCTKVIPEFTEIPVYRCGACDTVLRSKYHNPIVNVISGPVPNDSQKQLISSPSNNEATSSENVNEVDPIVNAAMDDNAKRESSEHEEEVPPALESEADKPVKLVHDDSRPIDMMEGFMDPTGEIVDSKEDVVGEGIGEIQSGQNASSSGVDGRDDRVPLKYRLLSKRTFRHTIVLDSADNKGNKEGEEGLTNDAIDANASARFQARRNLPESFTNSNGDNQGFTSRCSTRATERETSFDSQDFHSAVNWNELEDGELSRSLPQGSINHRRDSLECQSDDPPIKAKYHELDHARILKKVDELRDELGELFDQTIEKKQATNLGVIEEEGFDQKLDSNFRHHRHRHLHCPCLHCHQSFGPANQHPHMDSMLPSNHHNAWKQDIEPERSHHEEKKKPIKRHFRPLAGGSPFIVCYNCFKLLQLPADFLVSRRSLHKVQCGACFEVLMYSFSGDARKIAQTPSEAQHPPSEGEPEIASSNSFDYPPLGDPFSYSEEYAISDSSTEHETVLNVSRNSSDPMDDEREGKKVRLSQLHRLLAFSSSRRLLYQPVDGFDGGYESTMPTNFERGGIMTPQHQHSAAGASSSNVDDVSRRRSRARIGVSPLRGLLKKGIQELNHGLGSVKLKMHINGKNNQAP